MQQIFRTYSSCISETLCPLISNFPFPPCPVLGKHHSTIWLYNLFILDTSYKWNNIVFVLLWQAYFAWHNVFKIYLCWCILRNFLLFQGWIIFHCMYIPHFCYPLTGIQVVSISWSLWIVLQWTLCADISSRSWFQFFWINI